MRFYKNSNHVVFITSKALKAAIFLYFFQLKELTNFNFISNIFTDQVFKIKFF